jgi:hypothetical protein
LLHTLNFGKLKPLYHMERDALFEEFIRFSLNLTNYPDDFWKCWGLNNCGSCIQGDTKGCGWCPYVRCSTIIFPL